MKKDKLQQLTEQWERATEHATEQEQREQELANQELKRATAFPVKSTLKAGAQGYSVILSCNNWCN